MEAREAARLLETWFARHARDLPWRRTSDPYHVLLSEFILQQTRMESGVPYFLRILERHPTIESLASAPIDDVLALWSGLGYYRRARNLHRAARIIVDQHAGRVPHDAASLDALPGIGPYTAGAIASIAYDRPEPCIDGNQARVLGRFLGVRRPDAAAGRRRIEAWSRGMLRHGSPRAINQALMDIGATLCLPRSTQCATCPLSPGCRGRARARRPVTPRTAKPVEEWDVLVAVRDGRIWLREPRSAGLLSHLWLPPLRRARTPAARPDLVHDFSHKRWRLRLRRIERPPRGAGRWVSLDELPRLPHGRLTAEVARRVLG